MVVTEPPEGDVPVTVRRSRDMSAVVAYAISSWQLTLRLSVLLLAGAPVAVTLMVVFLLLV